MNRFTHGVVTTERERYVAHAAADQCAGQRFLDELRRFNEVDAVARVFFDTGRYRKDIWIENNVSRIEAHNVRQNFK